MTSGKTICCGVEPDKCAVAFKDLIVYRGKAFTQYFTWVGEDITSEDLLLQVKEFPGADTVLLELSTDNGYIVRAQDIQPAVSVDAFTGSLVRSSAADFSDVMIGDEVLISGSTSNDGTYYVTQVISPAMLRVDVKLTTEPAAGTVEVTQYGRFKIDIDAIATEVYPFDEGFFEIIGTESGIYTEDVLVHGRFCVKEPTTKPESLLITNNLGIPITDNFGVPLSA